MNPQAPRSWYKKKRYIIPIAGIVGLVGLANLGNNTSADVQSVQTTIPTHSVVVPVAAPSAVKQVAPVSQTVNATPQTKTTAPDTGLSNNNHYTNVDGNEVHSPAYSNSVPAGATAQCRDGTYSFSQHRSGTCSHHGGVADWL